MSDRPEDVDAAFAEIVAELEREGVGTTQPDSPAVDEPESGPEPAPGTTPGPASGPAPASKTGDPVQPWRGHDGEWDWSWGTDEEHYVPPEPPPLPRLRPLTIVALVLLAAGVVLLIVPGLIGLDTRIATPLALLALTSGGGMLLLRVRQAPPRDPNARDDGAQI